MFRLIAVISVLLLTSSPLVASSYKLESGEKIFDPTQPPKRMVVAPKAKAEKVNYQLNYIIHSANRAVAVINGQRVSEGQNVAGATVRKISSNQVELRVNGASRILRVNAASNFKKTN